MTEQTEQPLTPLAIIDRAIERGIDPAALEKLMDLQERWQKKLAADAWKEAKSLCDAEMPAAIATNATNSHTRSNYTRFETLMPAIKSIYTKHGFSLTFSEEEPKNDLMHIRADLSHKAGHTESYHNWFPRDGKGAKGGEVMNPIQGTCSTLSYAKREMCENIFGIAEGGKDVDGNGSIQTIDDEQLRKMNDLIDSCNDVGAPVDEIKFLLFAFDIKAIDPELHKRELLPLRRYKLVMAFLDQKWKTAKAAKEKK